MRGLLLDTHTALNWISNSSRVSHDQIRVIAAAERSGELLCISAISLLEITLLVEAGKLRKHPPLAELLPRFTRKPFMLLPVTAEIAFDVGSLPALKDPFDRTIAATARVHKLDLVTSDQRIIESNVVSTID
jgi:PIN domain nuclease of toxin-antitoxin system